jgi:hypothetical protein
MDHRQDHKQLSCAKDQRCSTLQLEILTGVQSTAEMLSVKSFVTQFPFPLKQQHQNLASVESALQSKEASGEALYACTVQVALGVPAL